MTKGKDKLYICDHTPKDSHCKDCVHKIPHSHNPLCKNHGIDAGYCSDEPCKLISKEWDD